MKLIKRSIEICFLPSLTISRALASLYPVFYLNNILFALCIFKCCKEMCCNQTEHEIKDVAFVIFYHKHFYCISVKYNVCMHVSVFVLMLLLPMAKKTRKEKEKKKSQAHSSYCVEIFTYF